MAAIQAALIAMLERTQTQQESVNAGSLIVHLSQVEANVNASPSMDRGAAQQLIAVISSWLRDHQDFQGEFCISLMFSILAKLLGQDTINDGIAIQKGLLSTTTTALQRQSHDEKRMRSCLEILAALTAMEGSDQILNRLGTVSALTKLLQGYTNNEAVLEDTLTTLAIMAKRTRHRRALMQKENLQPTMDALKRCLGARASSSLAACRFISNFAVKDECRMAVWHHGGIDALCSVFEASGTAARRQSSDVCAALTSALWACATDCTQVQQELMASGWPPYLATALQTSPDHVGLHEAAFGVVRCLSHNRQHQQEIVALGFVEAVTAAMRRFPDNQVIRKEGCGIFGNLATDADIRVQLGQKGVLEVIVAALDGCQGYDDRKVAKLAMGAIMNLATCEPNREILAQIQAVPSLLAAARAFVTNESILEYAVGALSHLTMHDVSNQQLIDIGAVEALMLVCSEHCDDLQLATKSLVALRRMYKHAVHAALPGAGFAVLEQIACAGSSDASRGVMVIHDAMREHIYDGVVVKEAALLLAGISKLPAQTSTLISVVYPTSMKALGLHQSDAPVADALACFMAELPLEEEEDWDLTGTLSEHGLPARKSSTEAPALRYCAY